MGKWVTYRPAYEVSDLRRKCGAMARHLWPEALKFGLGRGKLFYVQLSKAKEENSVEMLYIADEHVTRQPRFHLRFISKAVLY